MHACCVVAVGGAAAPFCCPALNSGGKALALCDCFAAGVFLTLALTHLLPESAEQLAGVVGEDGERFQAAHALALL
eukprot:gene9237-20932_t